jgi:hypothetical protein
MSNNIILDSSHEIEPIKQLSKNYFITFESSVVNHEDGITSYNFSNLSDLGSIPNTIFEIL